MSFRQDTSFCFSPSQRKTKREVFLRSPRLCGENRVAKASYSYLLSYYIQTLPAANSEILVPGILKNMGNKN